MGNVVIYTRVSTKKQSKSLEEQRSTCIRYAKSELGITRGKTLADICSGDDYNRENLLRMMKRIRSGKVDHVIVAHTDRLSRDSRQLYELLWEIRSNGAHISSVWQEFNTAKGVEKPFFRLLGRFSAEDRDALVKRTSRGRTKKVQSGSHAAGSPPYGYCTVNGELVIKEDEAAVVRKIFDMHEKGYSYGAIAKALNSESTPTKRGGKWHGSTIQQILTRSIYRGYQRQKSHGKVFEVLREELKIL